MMTLYCNFQIIEYISCRRKTRNQQDRGKLPLQTKIITKPIIRKPRRHNIEKKMERGNITTWISKKQRRHVEQNKSRMKACAVQVSIFDLKKIMKSRDVPYPHQTLFLTSAPMIKFWVIYVAGISILSVACQLCKLSFTVISSLVLTDTNMYKRCMRIQIDESRCGHAVFSFLIRLNALLIF